MKLFRKSARNSALVFLLALLGGVLSVANPGVTPAAKASANKRERARIAFDNAEKLRSELDGTPLSSRKNADYERVIQAYHKVYFINPASSYSPKALVSIAELHNQMGGDLKKAIYFKKAIDDYQFMMKEYPQSKLNTDAMFTIGLIYKNDLNDKEAALKIFEEYLAKYKRGPKVIAARENIRELKEKTDADEKLSKLKAAESEAGAAKNSEAEDETGQGRLVDYSRLPRVTNIRHWSTSNYTRIVIDIDGEVQYDQSRLKDPDRIFFDLKGTRLSSTLLGKSFPVEDGFLKEIRAGQFQANVVRVVLDLDKIQDYTIFPLYNPYRLVIDIRGVNPPTEKSVIADRTAIAPVKRGEAASEKKESASSTKANESKVGPKEETNRTPEPVESAGKETKANVTKNRSKIRETPEAMAPHAAAPNSDGSLSLTRSLGLKIGRIVIDPGHGGHDFGTIGSGGLAEKDLALDVSLRLGKLLEEKLGSLVVYTRDKDIFVPLEDRTALANQKQADLFISIHANSSRNHTASGVETFYLGIASKRDQETLDVVTRENAYSEQSLHDLQDVIKKITLNEKVEESREFASVIQKSIYSQASRWDRREKNRGVKKAHFIVLVGANMPSVLTEISFLSNPSDERLLKKSENRQKLAQALYEGILNYVKTLSGIKVARKVESDN